ncbi:MAG: hypothetical protein ABWY11_00525 [Umezawaea sp.]
MVGIFGRAVVVLAVGVAAVAGCSDGGGKAAAPTTSSTPVPLAPTEYQAALTKFDEAVRPVLDRAHAAGSDVDFGAAQQELVEVLDAQSILLEKLVPPAAVATAHDSLARGLGTASLGVRAVSVAAAAPNSCGITEPTLPAAKTAVDDKVRDLGQAYFAPLTTLGFQVGSFVPPPAVAPVLEERRAGNGEVVLRNGGQGPGTLKISNGSAGDIAVSVVSGDPSNPQVTVYVQGSSDTSVSGISGDYEVYFKSGVDWDAGRNGFTRDCSFEKFDDLFTGESDWQIDLQATPAGNASTSDVPAF